jgi:lipoate-protein ligase A
VLGHAQRELWTDRTLPVRVRCSGGGAVLSGPWLLRAAIVLPRSHALVQHGPSAAALWFGEIHRRWLQARGIDAASLYRSTTVDHWACFAGRAAGEVMVGDRKMVGIAQAWRGQTVLLSAGTLIAPAPWAVLCDALRRPADAAVALAALTISAQECLRRPVDARVWADELRDLLRGLTTYLGP